ncbi:MAG: hypothetical protein M4579_002754 [Chaenotheca gracillima]|nr:MAG: hypothetical protein M4579_002754 [Chaenotheca gracillima]
MLFSAAAVSLALATMVQGHTAVWKEGMYCQGGNDSSVDDQNTNLVVDPLYQLTKEEWWFQADRGCDKVPPKAGVFLEIPAGGKLETELAHNRAFTSLSYDGTKVTDWPDGGQHPEDWAGPGNPPDCIQDDGALHTQNQSMAAGTAFAISYQSEISEVTMENLVVFTTLQQYMQGFKCNVTGATSTTPIATAKAPVYCGDDKSKCVKGAKQMIAWQQATGNNVEPPQFVSPAYNTGFGWESGAQDDIFEASATETTSPTTAAAPPSSSTTATVASPSSAPVSSLTPTSHAAGPAGPAATSAASANESQDDGEGDDEEDEDSCEA